MRFAKSHGVRGPKVTRILAKAVGDGSGGKGSSGSDPSGGTGTGTGTADLEEIEENLREIAKNKLLYQELAHAYLINPEARLQVREREREVIVGVRERCGCCCGIKGRE